ncbi:unnamed protein product [Dicrocoelium dendriticum]|nr:unnamed protein product [Dicrocoelium dendriticum]
MHTKFGRKRVLFLLGLLLSIILCMYLFLSQGSFFHLWSRYSSRHIPFTLWQNSISQRVDPTVFCWVTTMPSNHQSKAVHVKNTWLRRCDGYVFISSEEDASLPAVALTHREGRNLLWNKTASALDYLSTFYGDHYDFFYKADDDTYAIVDNLKLLLRKFNSSSPLLMGYTHKAFLPEGYPSGGAGYVLSRAALHLMVRGLKTVDDCSNNANIFAEDVKIGACAQALHIPLLDSYDEDGGCHFYYESPFKRLSSSKMNTPFNFLNQHCSRCCCAHQPVSFHYIEPQEMYFLDYLLYTARSRPNS